MHKSKSGSRSEAQAQRAVDKFKPQKSDRGKFVMVKTTGEPVETKKQKGYLVYVTPKGKKQLHAVKDFRPHRTAEVILPIKKNLQKAALEFLKEKSTQQGKVRAMSKGQIHTQSWTKTAKAIARDLTRTMNENLGMRDYLVKGVVRINTPQGDELMDVQTIVSKPHNVHVPLDAMQHFVERIFYKQMSQQLAWMGYVTKGSARHIRGLPENQGKDEDEWVDTHGDPWQGAGLEVVDILDTSWQFDQLL